MGRSLTRDDAAAFSMDTPGSTVAIGGSGCYCDVWSSTLSRTATQCRGHNRCVNTAKTLKQLASLPTERHQFPACRDDWRGISTGAGDAEQRPVPTRRASWPVASTEAGVAVDQEPHPPDNVVRGWSQPRGEQFIVHKLHRNVQPCRVDAPALL